MILTTIKVQDHQVHPVEHLRDKMQLKEAVINNVEEVKREP
jgi:hypothetical protein